MGQKSSLITPKNAPGVYQSQSFKTMELRNALVGFVMLCKLTFGTTKNPLHEYRYNRLESASKLPTILKYPIPKPVDDCWLPTINLVH